MKRVETEYWKPHPDKPGYVVYDKGRSVREVFAELRSRLEAAGYLPDEYFLIGRDWEDGRPWPRDGDIFCAVDYGGSEGIYLDIYLKYMDENNKSHTTSFATGKTLGESETDLDRMYLIASAVTKAFHSDGVHARYVQVGGQTAENGAVIHLSEREAKIAARSLLETRESLKAQGKPTEVQEQLLRRITGSVSAYTKALNDFKITDAKDRALLA
ncbi:MAG: ankyrin repeat domain-containing protein, partial [Oscillospiraceae bacterium]|nr:ankyrin repeat domain-containing protein [Oscillospiraceae bacterium]